MNTNNQGELRPVAIDQASGQPWLWQARNGRFYRLDNNNNLIETNAEGRLMGQQIQQMQPNQNPNLTPVKNDAYGNPEAWTDGTGKFYKLGNAGYYEVDERGRPMQQQIHNNQYNAYNPNVNVNASVGFNGPKAYSGNASVGNVGFGSGNATASGNGNITVPRNYAEEIEAFNNTDDESRYGYATKDKIFNGEILVTPNTVALTDTNERLLSEEDGWSPESYDCPPLIDEDKESLKLISDVKNKTFKYVIINK